METTTVCDPIWTPDQSVEYFQQKMNLPVLTDMLTTFFRAKASDKGNELLRRPPVAIRMLGEAHIFTIRPGWKSPGIRYYAKDNFCPSASDLVLDADACNGRYVKVQEYGHFQFDTLFVDTIHEDKGRCAKFHFDETKIRLTSWYQSKYFDALDDFAQTSKEFVLFPWQVLSRSKNNCCVCGKSLTDEISRGRGIGPECVKIASHCFGQPLK